MALMAGAMILQGIVPGPNVIRDQPGLFWGLITSMWVGNLMLVLLNLPLVGIWVRLLRVPYYALFPAIIVFSAIGVYSTENSGFVVYRITIFGLFGYSCRSSTASRRRWCSASCSARCWRRICAARC